MSPVVITLLAVFVGTAALCAAVGFSFVAQREDPLKRLDRLNRRLMPSKESSGILKEELLAEGAEGLAELWKRIGISPRSIRAWYRQAELPIQAWLLLAISGLLSLGLVAAARRLHTPTFVYPIVGLVGAVMPLWYVV